jgi:hypothetical protein
VKQIAKHSEKPIPINSLSNALNQTVLPRGRTIFGFPGNYLDQIARNYDGMRWWVSENGVNMEVIASIGGNISPFDERAGRLMFEARSHRLSNGRLPLAEYSKIVDILDRAGFKPLDYLRGEFRKELAAWNQKYPKRAIHTFEKGLDSKLSLARRGIQKRLYRAESVWKKLTELSTQ